MAVTISYAKHTSDEVLHISEVRAPGLACACVCLECGWKLEAVNAFNPDAVKEPHFRHHRTEDQDVWRCVQRSTRAALERAAADLKWLDIPEFTLQSYRHVNGRRVVAKATAAGERVVITEARQLSGSALLLDLDDGRQLVVLLGLQLSGLPEGAAVIESSLSADEIASSRPAAAIDKLRSASLNWYKHWRSDELTAECAMTLANAPPPDPIVPVRRESEDFSRARRAAAVTALRKPAALDTAKATLIWTHGGSREAALIRHESVATLFTAQGFEVLQLLEAAYREGVTGTRANHWMRDAMVKFGLPGQVVLDAMLTARLIRQG